MFYMHVIAMSYKKFFWLHQYLPIHYVSHYSRDFSSVTTSFPCKTK